MSIINFASETIEILHDHDYTIEDISWIGTHEFTIPIHEFFDVARKTDYNNGYGSANIPCDLIIMMKDGSWYSRGEYDGSEWWDYNPQLSKPAIQLHLKTRNFIDVDYDWDPTLAEACGIRR